MSIKIDITGHLGQDPELQFGQDGTPRCRIRVAAVPRVKNRQTDQWEDDGETHWYSVTVFGANAESLASAVSKGSRVRVSGTLVHRSWQGKDGQSRIDHEVKYSDVTLYPPKSSQNPGQGARTQSQWGSTHPGAFQGAQDGSVQSVFEDTTPPF